MRDGINLSPQPGLEALHLAAFLSALLLLVWFLTGRRRVSCKPGPQDVHPQEVESAPRSLQNTCGTNSVTLGTALAGVVQQSGGLVLPRKPKELEYVYRLDQGHHRMHGNQRQWQVSKINGLILYGLGTCICIQHFSFIYGNLSIRSELPRKIQLPTCSASPSFRKHTHISLNENKCDLNDLRGIVKSSGCPLPGQLERNL